MTLGIVPGIGAMVVPYRRWPAAAATFHRMLVRAERLRAAEAHELGVVDELADGFDDLIVRSIARVHALAAAGITRIGDAPVELPPFEPHAGTAADGRPLSAQVVCTIEAGVREAAAQSTLGAALEAGYRAFGAVACTAAAREGIDAFVQRREPDFGKTG